MYHRRVWALPLVILALAIDAFTQLAPGSKPVAAEYRWQFDTAG